MPEVATELNLTLRRLALGVSVRGQRLVLGVSVKVRVKVTSVYMSLRAVVPPEFTIVLYHFDQFGRHASHRFFFTPDLIFSRFFRFSEIFRKCKKVNFWPN
jgi:hypothetical protein